MMLIFAILIVAILYFFNKICINFLFKNHTKDQKKSSDDHKSSDDYNYGYDNYTNNYEKYSRSRPNSKNNTKEDATNFIVELCQEIRDDFVKSPYNDKFLTDDPSFIIGYVFENGRTIRVMNDLSSIKDEDSYTIKTTKANLVFVNILLDFFNKCASQTRQRNGRKPSEWNHKYNKYASTDSKKYTEEQLKYQEMFRKLKEQNDLRMDQLQKMSKTNPDRPALVNEANVVKRKMKIAYDKSGLKPI